MHAVARGLASATTEAKCAHPSRAQINLEDGDGLDVVKSQLTAALGIPATDMKLRLCGRNQARALTRLLARFVSVPLFTLRNPVGHDRQALQHPRRQLRRDLWCAELPAGTGSVSPDFLRCAPSRARECERPGSRLLQVGASRPASREPAGCCQRARRQRRHEELLPRFFGIRKF